MNKFYTNFYCNQQGNIKVRGWENGRRFDETVKYKPRMFIKSKSNNPSGFMSMEGEPLEEVNFEKVSEARDFVKRYEDVANFNVYGSKQWAYSYIFEKYKGIVYDVEQISVVNIDIEVGADEFPDPYKANWPITAITMERGGKIVSLGCKPYENSNPDVKYVLCQSEEDLAEKFLYYWANFDPDVVTGWNIDGFDIPYLVNRLKKLLGDESAKRLSPHRRIDEREVTGKFGKVRTLYEIAGVANLDYMELYKKFSFKNEESYSLDNIAFVTIGEKKMDYSEVASLNELYKTNFQKYMDYNIRDVLLVKRIDEKLGFLAQVFAIAYDSLVTFNDTFTSVKIWEVIMYNYLMEQKIIPKMKGHSRKEKKIVGGYVKEPIPGRYEWVVSFDLNSLYPHLIMQYNISPETLAGQIDDLVFDDVAEKAVDMIMNGFIDKEKTSILKEKNLSLTAGGAVFTKSKRGFVPILMEKMYNDRTIFKKKMLAEKQVLVDIDEELKKRGIKL